MTGSRRACASAKLAWKGSRPNWRRELSGPVRPSGASRCRRPELAHQGRRDGFSTSPSKATEVGG